MNKHILYAKYILRHKWFVLVECAKRGILWRGLMHDMSKMLPSEWTPYVNNFYGNAKLRCKPCEGTGRDGQSDDYPYSRLMCKNCLGSGVVKAEYEKAFDFAWLLHQKRNKHHWQFWVLREDSGKTKCFPMPEPYRTEMLCDWIGAGRAITGKVEVNTWYNANKHKMQLHQETRVWLEGQLVAYP